MTEKNKKEPLLEIQDLRVLFPVHKKWLPAVDGVNLSIRPGEITGVVGESGSGKSVSAAGIRPGGTAEYHSEAGKTRERGKMN